MSKGRKALVKQPCMSVGKQVVLYWTNETVAQVSIVPWSVNFVRRTAGEMPVRMTKTGPGQPRLL